MGNTNKYRNEGKVMKNRRLISTLIYLAIVLLLLPNRVYASYTYDEIYEEGYESGYDYGHNLGRQEGNEEGYQEGYDDGYNVGYEAASQEKKDDPIKTVDILCILVVSVLSLGIVLDLLNATKCAIKKMEFKSGLGNFIERSGESVWWLPLVIAAAFAYGVAVMTGL